MRHSLWIVAASVLCVSQSPSAVAKPAQCDGYFVASEQGYKKAPSGLVPSGPMVPEGSTIAFAATGRMGGKAVLYQAGSPLIFDSENISLTTGCRIPTR